ncbi:MAG: sortase [Clostridia bacterium]|nr:sortase [Clostridia bacterium]
MDENKKNSLPDGISSITDDEAIKEIDFGSFLEENAKGSPLFEGFHDDIEKTEKSLENELQSLYDDIMGSGPATIVPKPMSLLTAEDAEPAKIALSDPELPKANEESSLEDLWIDPEEYMDIPVVSLDEETEPQESQSVIEGEIPAEAFFSPETPEEQAVSIADIAKDDIFSLINSLKTESEGETGFEDILSEIEANPEIVPVDVNSEAAAQLVTPQQEEKIAFEEEKEEPADENGDDVDFDELVAQEEMADSEVDFEASEQETDPEEDFDRELAILLGDIPAEETEIKKPSAEGFVIEIPDEDDEPGKTDDEFKVENDAQGYELQPEYSAVVSTEKSAPIDITAHDDDEEYENILDEPEAEKPEKKSGIGEVIRKIVLTLSIITIVVSLGVLVNTYFIEPYKAKTATQSLAEQMSQNQNAHSDAVIEDTGANADSKYPQGMLAKYAQLYDANDDLSGWISIPALQIELPIAIGEDNDYYRNRDIYKKYTMYGVPIFDYRMTDLRNLHRNTVLYGHNMRSDDLIFGMLENYRTIEGYQSAPVIECNTIYGDHTWFVYGVFLSNAYENQDNGYVFPYNFIDISDAKFADYIEEIDKRKLYTTGVDLNVNDKILTLSTCCYDFADARLVVVARLKRDGESISVDTSNAYKNPNPKYPQAWYDANKKTNPYAEDARW